MEARRGGPRDWSRVTSSREEWEQFCGRVGMKFVAVAARRVTDRGESVAAAVNATIAETAEEMRRDGAPAELVDMFVADYSAARAHQMALVSDWLEHLGSLEEKPATRRRRLLREP